MQSDTSQDHYNRPQKQAQTSTNYRAGFASVCESEHKVEARNVIAAKVRLVLLIAPPGLLSKWEKRQWLEPQSLAFSELAPYLARQKPRASDLPMCCHSAQRHRR
jgi:hypothetical protein